MTGDPYRDPAFVERYDSDNRPGEDHAYYLRLADAIDARKIVDLGCGTGLLTRAFVKMDRAVVGVDPSTVMLAYARRQIGASAVTWVCGDASALPGNSDVDLVVSAGNTMMHIDPESYPMVLGCLLIALRNGGVFTFETRNPGARAWERWNPPRVDRQFDTSTGMARERLVWHSLGSTTVLYFRDVDDLASDLERAGFADIDVRGGWHGEPVTAESRSLVINATRPRSGVRS